MQNNWMNPANYWLPFESIMLHAIRSEWTKQIGAEINAYHFLYFISIGAFKIALLN